MLEVRDLSVNYGHFTALHSVSLTVDPGEIVVMLGANGAGTGAVTRRQRCANRLLNNRLHDS